MIGTFGNDRLETSAAGQDLTGLAGDDTLLGWDRDVRLDGGDGNDDVTIITHEGADTLIGGSGDDTLSLHYWDAATSFFYVPDNVTYVVDLPGQTMGVEGSVEGRDQISGFESVYAWHVNAPVKLFGDASDNLLVTGNTFSSDWDSFEDSLRGGAGNDTLDGGSSSDVLDGGAADDLIRSDGAMEQVTTGLGRDVILQAPRGAVQIADFAPGDRLLLSTDLPGSVGTVDLKVADLRFDPATGRLVTAGAEVSFVALPQDYVLMTRSSGTYRDGLLDRAGIDVTLVAPPSADTEGQRIEAAGLQHQRLYDIGAFRDRPVEVSVLPGAKADFANVVGLYRIQADGSVSHVQLLSTNAREDAPSSVVDTAPGALGLFIVRDGATWADALTEADTLSFAGNAGGSGSLTLHLNDVEVAEDVLHSYATHLNPGNALHTASWMRGGTLTFGFEDMSTGSDRDFQDVLLSVTQLTSPSLDDAMS